MQTSLDDFGFKDTVKLEYDNSTYVLRILKKDYLSLDEFGL